MTTREKLELMIDHLETIEPGELDESARGLADLILIAEGFGLNIRSFVIPSSDAAADKQIDDLITLLFQLRGDDLPPYSFERHVTDATALDDAEAEA